MHGDFQQHTDSHQELTETGSEQTRHLLRTTASKWSCNQGVSSPNTALWSPLYLLELPLNDLKKKKKTTQNTDEELNESRKLLDDRNEKFIRDEDLGWGKTTRPQK